MERTEEAPKQREKKENKDNIYVHKPKRGGNKPGQDRRFRLRSRQFDENTKVRMEGGEVIKPVKVSFYFMVNHD